MVLIFNDSILKDYKNSRQHQYDICSYFLISSQVEKYAFNIVEKGTRVNEEVEVDEDEQTEVIRVPKHNDVDAVELLNDFNAVIYKLIQDQFNVQMTLSKFKPSGLTEGLTVLVHCDRIVYVFAVVHVQLHVHVTKSASQEWLFRVCYN